jgi:hypothetical protein
MCGPGVPGVSLVQRSVDGCWIQGRRLETTKTESIRAVVGSPFAKDSVETVVGFGNLPAAAGARLKENGDLAPHDTREHGVAREIDRIIAEHARGVSRGVYSDDFRDEPDKPFEGAAALQLLSSMSSPRVASPPRMAILRRYPARPSKGVAAATYTNLPGPLADEQEQMRSISSAAPARIATRL